MLDSTARCTMEGSSSRESAIESIGESNVKPASFHETCWYACRTRARAEKRAASLLANNGFESYLPVIERLRQWSDRKKLVAFPLFPGYVFARFDLQRSYDVVNIPGIVDIVGVDGEPAPIRDVELESVSILVSGVNAGEEMPRLVETFTAGQVVIVIDGAFAGMRGVLLEERGRTRVVVRLSGLCQAVSVELPRRFLRSVQP